jgi:hypothetical protein
MASFNEILKTVEKAIDKFNGKIPAIQRDMLAAIEEELRRLDLSDGKIKPTVKNLSILTSIRNKINRVILTDDYKGQVKEFASAFNDVYKLQNEYWKQAESTFKPRALLKEIKNQAVEDTVGKLLESGIDVNLGEPITDILRQNITGGGSYRSLTEQMREFLTNTKKSPGGLEKYARQMTTD